METVKHLAVTYKPLIDNTLVSVIISEYRLWTEKWKRDQAIPQTFSDRIMHCDGDMYPNMKKLLCIPATLPVSVAMAERSFSTLRRLKTWLRASIAEYRLTGLALLHIHKNVPVDVEEVINRFARRQKRKIDFVI
ncbi:unnamed protein product [Psylliodes chrysocephalus]|uniref:HAT C-terminal dimerisation domain-containing protein n=1 Tax=Psylliodes chrysocephalus TaxID=3402493 RepID=A0A9P0GFG5_9CUCU|nr:unnamed protein product [Psylliodes chrysocephala]